MSESVFYSSVLQNAATRVGKCLHHKETYNLLPKSKFYFQNYILYPKISLAVRCRRVIENYLRPEKYKVHFNTQGGVSHSYILSMSAGKMLLKIFV